MNRRTLLYLYIVVCVALACVACNQGTVYNQYESTNIKGWERNDTISFQTEAMTVSGNYHEEVGVRINGDYPFMGLSLVVEQTVMPSRKSYNGTLTCHLIDESGNAIGNGINHYQYLFPLTTLKLDKGDYVRIAIRHCMKREILPGILDVGVKLSHQVSARIKTEEDEK